MDAPDSALFSKGTASGMRLKKAKHMAENLSVATIEVINPCVQLNQLNRVAS